MFNRKIATIIISTFIIIITIAIRLADGNASLNS